MAGKAIVLKVDTEKYPQLAARFPSPWHTQLRCLLWWAPGDAAGRLGQPRANGAVAQVRRSCFGLMNGL